MKETTCPVCGGLGETGFCFQLDDGSISDDIQPCEVCDGTGGIASNEMGDDVKTDGNAHIIENDRSIIAERFLHAALQYYNHATDDEISYGDAAWSFRKMAQTLEKYNQDESEILYDMAGVLEMVVR